MRRGALGGDFVNPLFPPFHCIISLTSNLATLHVHRYYKNMMMSLKIAPTCMYECGISPNAKFEVRRCYGYSVLLAQPNGEE